MSAHQQRGLLRNTLIALFFVLAGSTLLPPPYNPWALIAAALLFAVCFAALAGARCPGCGALIGGVRRVFANPANCPGCGQDLKLQKSH
jgi:hypothetical protein